MSMGGFHPLKLESVLAFALYKLSAACAKLVLGGPLLDGPGEVDGEVDGDGEGMLGVSGGITPDMEPGGMPCRLSDSGREYGWNCALLSNL